MTSRETKPSIEYVLAGVRNAAEGKRLVVCDLDNTLMDESRYLFAGYETIARQAGEPRAASWMKDQFEYTGQEGLFEITRKTFPGMKGSLEEWLETLRWVEVTLPVLAWVQPFCEALPDVPMAILTNGDARQQRNKYRQLQPAAVRDRFRLYCAVDTKPKPSPAGLLRILNDYHCPAWAALMIGDSQTDADCAAAAGVSFYSILPPPLPSR
jgi:HAD superfamily hydrolase (TIGR01549 family)